MLQLLNKISPALNTSNLTQILGGKIGPQLDCRNPDAYYRGMENLRMQGCTTVNPMESSSFGNMGQNIGQNMGQMGQMGGFGTPAPQQNMGFGTQTPQSNMGGMGGFGGQMPPQQNMGGMGGFGTPAPQQNMGFGAQAPQQNMGGMGGFGNQAPQPVPQQSGMMQAKPRRFGSGVSLRKGQKVNLSDGVIHEVDIGLGWDALNNYDLDASAFLLGADGKVIGDAWFVFYGQPDSPDGAVHHSGDSNGVGAGDDEIIRINLDRLNPQVEKIVFIVTIDSALQYGYNFSNVKNAYMRVINRDNNQELMRFSLSDYYANVTSMVVGELYKHNGRWKVNPVGDGVAADLAGLCARYGVEVAD